ncbi:hypothetical protein MBLNU230_g1746t1 [Neophaeotheca triangularis]
MALPVSAARHIACHNCQRTVLRSFIASIGGAPPPTLPRVQPRRDFSQNRPLREARRAGEEDHPLNDINETPPEPEHDAHIPYEAATSTQEKATPSSGTYQPFSAEAQPETPLDANKPTGQSDSSLPWYLQQQHQPSLTQESPQAARQQLPELPINPPAILQPLLDHVSVQLGMDDLSLLDLRALDPPPALGANLLMIIGTARSEKHLHVSADRLCRWLRSEYKIHPNADGLLGRQELKLKMRRKLKRSRLLSAVGAKSTADTDMEEGIRTGWVCVNVGRVEGGELPEDVEKMQRSEGFVGFGARTSGCSIVVQMMTEEKRGELDLEKLWNGIVKRAKQDSDSAVEHRVLDSAAEDFAQAKVEDEGRVQHV